MNDQDLQYFKGKLEEEFKVLVGELKSVGHVNKNNPKDWEPSAPKPHASRADNNENADLIEEYEENTAILKDLEIRFNNVKDALARIEGGSFGTCNKGEEQIERERLEANPAATTCIAHKDEA